MLYGGQTAEVQAEEVGEKAVGARRGVTRSVVSWFCRIKKPVWVPTTRATSVTRDTAVDSLSAATTTMNSGVSPCPGGSWHPRVPVTASAPWETAGWPAFSDSLGDSVGE